MAQYIFGDTAMKFTARLSCGPASPFTETEACFVFPVHLLRKLASEMPNGDPTVAWSEKDSAAILGQA